MDKIKILIVEDEVLIALSMKVSLIKAGYTVCAMAASGEEAVIAAKKESPDVLLMDIRLLGVMDGIEAAQLICTFSSPCIIFTTGYDDPGIKERASVLNPSAFLNKPVKIIQISAIIEQNYENKH